MKPKHRRALMALAARRGEKEFSSILVEERRRRQRREEFLSLEGSLSGEEAEALRGHVRSLRENWR